MDNPYDHLVLYDGVCMLCSRAVRLIARNDKRDIFRFAPIQSEIAQKIIQDGNIPDKTDSIIYVRYGRIFTRSGAALRIAKDLQGLWKTLYVLIVIPPFIRDLIYDLVAKYRYRIFGKTEQCTIPGNELMGKIIGAESRGRRAEI